MEEGIGPCASLQSGLSPRYLLRSAHAQDSVGWVEGCESYAFQGGDVGATANLKVASGAESVGYIGGVTKHQQPVTFSKVEVLDCVLTLAKDEPVSTLVAVRDVVTLVGADEVITVAAPENISAFPAEQLVIVLVTGENVVAETTLEDVITLATFDCVRGVGTD